MVLMRWGGTRCNYAAPLWGARGRVFESHRPDQSIEGSGVYWLNSINQKIINRYTYRYTIALVWVLGICLLMCMCRTLSWQLSSCLLIEVVLTVFYWGVPLVILEYLDPTVPPPPKFGLMVPDFTIHTNLRKQFGIFGVVSNARHIYYMKCVGQLGHRRCLLPAELGKKELLSPLNLQLGQVYFLPSDFKLSKN